MKAKIKNYKCVTPGLPYYVQAYDRFEALHIVRKKQITNIHRNK